MAKLGKVGEKLTSAMEGLTPRQLLMLAAGAGVLTFIPFYWCLSSLSKDSTPAEVPKTQMVKVVQAKSDIPARVQLRESMMQVAEIPSNLAPEGVASDIGSLVGKPTRVAIMAGDVITNRKLFASVKDSGFTGVIPPDRRAVTIGVDDVTGVAGLAKPGDFVDIMLISEKLDSNKISGEIILQNVQLLSINQTTERHDEHSGAQGSDKDKAKNQNAAESKPASATLAVRPEEELRLAVAAQAGRLYLALRPYKPSNMYVLDTDYYISKGGRGQASTPAIPRTPPQALPRPPVASGASSAAPSDSGSQMEIIRGTKASRGQ